MRPNVPSFNPARARSYIFRLPLFTRLIIGAIVLVGALCFQTVWDIRQWGALVPNEISLTSAYRANTYPFIHVGVTHAILNILALTPLIERFESEYGTLTSLALFFGPLSTVPAFLYVLAERLIFRSNVAVMGASVWVFLLLGMEAIRNYKVNPYLVVGTHQIPTWTTPLLLVLVVAALIPGTSLLGHLCGLAVGYGYGLGYLQWLSPPEKALRWIESRLNLLGHLPHYVSVDQKTYGRFGVLPSSHSVRSTPSAVIAGPN